MADEVLLEGGLTSTVVRIGDAVHRSTGPWTPGVHALLRHLENEGFGGAPRVHGLDAHGREILSFLPGDVAHPPLPDYALTDDAVEGAARLLRRYHDASASFRPAEGTVWRHTIEGEREVMCHHDAAPYNMVFRDGQPVALFDFDFASPGPRAWDVAYAVYTWAPLYRWEATPEAWSEALRRLGVFIRGYGRAPLGDLGGTLVRRIEAMALWLGSGEPGSAQARLVEEGHLDHCWEEIVHLRNRVDEINAVVRRVQSEPIRADLIRVA